MNSSTELIHFHRSVKLVFLISYPVTSALPKIALLNSAFLFQRFFKTRCSQTALYQIRALHCSAAPNQRSIKVAHGQKRVVPKQRMDKNALYQIGVWTNMRCTKLAYGQIRAGLNWRMAKYAPFH